MATRAACSTCFHRGYIDHGCQSCAGWGTVLLMTLAEVEARDARARASAATNHPDLTRVTGEEGGSDG